MFVRPSTSGPYAQTNSEAVAAPKHNYFNSELPYFSIANKAKVTERFTCPFKDCTYKVTGKAARAVNKLKHISLHIALKHTRHRMKW